MQVDGAIGKLRYSPCYQSQALPNVMTYSLAKSAWIFKRPVKKQISY